MVLEDKVFVVFSFFLIAVGQVHTVKVVVGLYNIVAVRVALQQVFVGIFGFFQVPDIIIVYVPYPK
jgi:hypothetical protein